MTIRLTSKGETRLFRTRFAFACNNPEELDYFHLRGRSCIEAGNLTLYLPKPLSKGGIIGLGLRLLARKTEENRDFEMVCAPEFHLEIEPSRVPVSLDGEVEMMEAPLRYRLLPGALPVRVPVMRDRTGMSG
jgi:diacylglycerol kinase family enzyme